MIVKEVFFIVSNVGIALSYAYIAIYIVPRVTAHLKRTKIGGVGFFTLCGLHHLEGVFHFLFQPHEEVQHVYTSLHMLLIDIPQAIFVWLFVTGLYLEFVRWGPWGDHWRTASRLASDE